MRDTRTLRELLFLKISLIAFIFYLVMIPVNLFMQVGCFHEDVLIMGAVILGVLYLLARFYEKYLYVLFYLIVIGTLSVIWFTNAGYKGSIPFYLSAPVVLSCIFWRGKKRIFFVAVAIADVIILATVQYYHPELIYEYRTEFGRYVDVIAGIISSFVIVAIGVSIAVEAFYREKKMVEEKNVELSLKAITDPLTGLYNRAYLLERLGEAMQRSERYGYPLCLIEFDIDHFKEINDTHGHLAGDFVLKEIALALKNSVRSSDVIGRYGGEEFFIILENTKLEDAWRVAEKVRRTVSRLKLGKGLGHPTISGGVAMYKKGEGIEEFIKRADVALYRAKALGRNRVEWI